MTPLTHAVVGTALFHHLRRPWAGRLAWVLAFPLAFASHYLLDAIPHFEDLGPLLQFRYSPWVFLGLALVGSGLAGYLYRRNRQAGLLWLMLCGGIGLAAIPDPLARILAALALLGYVAYRTRQAVAVGYLLAGILAIAADWMPRSWTSAVAFHNRMHAHLDWGTALYIKYEPSPVPVLSWADRVENPYFLAGYGLEILVEALIFLAAFSVFFRLQLEPKAQTETSEVADAVASREGGKGVTSREWGMEKTGP
jgi:hypothetical protein